MSIKQRFAALYRTHYSSKSSRLIATVLLAGILTGFGTYLRLGAQAFASATRSAAYQGHIVQSRVLGVDSQTTTTSSDGGSVGDSIPPANLASLTAGRVPGRVLLGFAASDSLRPTYDEAVSITGTVYERRQFKSNWYSATALNSMLDACDARNQYCVVSFKVPGNNWKAVTGGQYNSDLDNLIATALARPKPFALAIHHEPQGDGVAQDWAAMQEYLVQYLAPANSKMAFTTIGNGFWWGPNQGKGDAYVSTYYPDSLIAKMNQYHGVIAADFYDAVPDASGRYKTNADRTSMKLQAFTDWARAKGVQAIGAGEFGDSSAVELSASWKVMHDNSDIWTYANYFNSLANAKVDWRLVPISYPAYNSNLMLDAGGTLTSDARLIAFKAALTESVIPN